MNFTPLTRKGSPLDLAIDLGTANVLIADAGGVLLDAPTCVAVRTHLSGDPEILAFGHQALALAGKTASNISVVFPLNEGVIRDLGLTLALLKHFLREALGRRFRFLRPRLLLSLPKEVTGVEERAFRQVAEAVGAKQVALVPEPLAAAVGSGRDILAPRGMCLVDVGAGTTELALLSLGGVVHSAAVRVGGNTFDQDLQRYFRRRHDFSIGLWTAESLKRTCDKAQAADVLEVHGMEIRQRRPALLKVEAAELQEALLPTIARIVNTVVKALESVPDETNADLLDHGLILAGGGALTHGLRASIAERSGLRVHLAERTLHSVVLGEMEILRRRELWQGLQLSLGY